MNFEAYYGASYYQKMLETAACLNAYVDALKGEGMEDDLQPIVYAAYRIKKPESMMRKLEARGFPPTREAARESVYDAVGFRIVCSFESDVHAVIRRLEACTLFTVEKKKDYLSYPKPNGYRSIHLCVRMRDSGVLAEIQVRTIAMDFWATLEHQLKYKKETPDDLLMKCELKRCADEIASVDLTMQTIRELLKQSE